MRNIGKYWKVLAVLLLVPLMMRMAACSGSPQSRLKEMIELSNKECPASIDHVTSLIAIKDEGNFVTYVCQIDEDVLDMDEMQANRAIYEQNIKNTFHNQLTLPESTSGPFLQLVIEAGKGLRHHYVGKNSRKTLDIDITNEQMRQLAQPVDNQQKP